MEPAALKSTVESAGVKPAATMEPAAVKPATATMEATAATV
jgi:hypothetical protein